MQSQSMRNRRKLTVAPKPILLFVLSVIVYLGILVLNSMLYSGIISMTLFQIMFVFLSAWNLSAALGKNESLHRSWINVWITAIVLCIQILTFFVSLPGYTTTKATDIIELSTENIKITEGYTMDTLEPLSPLVKSGYAFVCTESTTDRQFTVFFNPISGEYYEMN